MLLTQEFKTSEGARKRASFENAHTKTFTYKVIRCRVGQRDVRPFNPDDFHQYTWRLERTVRKLVGDTNGE